MAMPVNGEPGRSSDDSDTSEHVQEAVAALNRLEVHDHMAQDGRITVTIEQADRAVDDVDRVEGSSYAPLAQDLVTYAVDNVKASCGVLVNVLDELSRVHPFVSVVALAFKTAIKLEMTRRENDKRVLALHAEMCNMMTVVALIRDFPADPQVNNALELRLSSRMKRIADDIKDCAAKCDSFQNKAVIVRLLTSFKWEETLNAFAAAFSAHKEDLHKDLVLLATSEIKAANVTLASVHAQVERVDLRLDLLRSPEELELLRFIDSKGGAQRVSEDDNLRQELDMEIERIGIDREDRLIGRVADLWEDVGKNLQITFTGLFYQNEDALERKFQLGLDRFENVLITTMRQVSFERTPTGSHCSEIIDTDLRQLWQDMGWHARPAVDEVIKNLLTRSLEHIHTPPGSQRSESPLASFYVEPEDPWASKYLSERWKQGLVEAIDLDGSAHVTIAELNSFSLSRPGGWSLPRWVAYWTVGSPLALIWYYKRIRELLKKIRPISANVLPINRAYIQRLLGEGVFYACDCLLSGVYKILYLLEEDASVFEKFEDFELSEEQKLRLAIQSVNYELDTPTTVALVIGNRCLDKMILPLLYIMVERCIETIQEASSAALQRDRVFALRTSLWTLLRSSYRRIDALKDMAASRNVDDVQALHRSVKHFSFGLYRYIYFNEKLGTCKYLRDEARSHEGYFTPGSSDAFIRSDGANGPSQDIPPATQVVSREPWVQDDVLEVVTNQDHDMHPFVQLCIEQSVMMPDGEPDDAFSLMAQAAVARVGRKDEIALEEIFQSGSHRPRRQDSLRLARALTEQDITILAQKYSLEQQRLYCRLVDNVVRRQVLHSPVMCDKCRRHTMNMTRLICLGCQETSERLSSKPRTLKNGKTTDYCSKCLFEDLMLDCAAALLSSSYHAFLQVRRFTYNKWDHAALDIARRRSLEESVAHAFLDEDLLVNEVTAPKFAASQGTEQRRSLPTCCMCGLWLSLPFWSCIDCTEKTYMCPDCNLAQEKKLNILVLEDVYEYKDSAAEQGAGKDGHDPSNEHSTGHHWSHSLTLVISTGKRKLPSMQDMSRHRVSIVGSPTQAWSPSDIASAMSLSRAQTPTALYTDSPFQMGMLPTYGQQLIMMSPFQVASSITPPGFRPASVSSWPRVPLLASPPSPWGPALSLGSSAAFPASGVDLPAGFVPQTFTPSASQMGSPMLPIPMPGLGRTLENRPPWSEGTPTDSRSSSRQSSLDRQRLLSPPRRYSSPIRSGWRSVAHSPPTAETFQSFAMPQAATSGTPAMPAAQSADHPPGPSDILGDTPYRQSTPAEHGEGQRNGQRPTDGSSSVPEFESEGWTLDSTLASTPSLTHSASTRPSTATPGTPTFAPPAQPPTPTASSQLLAQTQASPSRAVPPPRPNRMPQPLRPSELPSALGSRPPPAFPHVNPRRAGAPQIYGPPVSQRQRVARPPPPVPLAPPQFAPPANDPPVAPSGSGQENMTEYKAELRKLNERLGDIEDSVYRVSRRLSTRLDDHREDVERLMDQVKGDMGRLLGGRTKHVLTAQPSSSVADVAEEAVQATPEPTIPDVVEELSSRIAVIEHKLAAIELASPAETGQAADGPSSIAGPSQDASTQTPPTPAVESLGIVTPPTPARDATLRKGMWQRASLRLRHGKTASSSQ